jgi:hypothetical protein
MGGRSKKSKRRHSLSSKKKFQISEDIAYYFLAVIGVVIVALIIIGILGFLKII